MREDGYHLIDSVFQSIDLGDRITIETSTRKQINIKNYHLPPQNTVSRALELVEEATGKTFNVSITVDKKVPPGSGLGAGSSNAAAVLYGINSLFGLGLAEDDLVKLGARIGADVPFFIKGGMCQVSGIGERVKRVNARLPYRVMVVIPRVSISTREAYSWWDEQPHQTSLTSDEFLDLLAKEGRINYYNSFEPLIASRYPEIKKMLEIMRSYGLAAGISGSGSSLFALYSDQSEVRKLDYEIRKYTDKIFYANATDQGVLEID